jgi:hypothetical protein
MLESGLLPLKLNMNEREIKFLMWIKNPPKIKFPVPLNLPKFSKKSFRNYEEMNNWKREYLQEIARAGGIKWKIS